MQKTLPNHIYTMASHDFYSPYNWNALKNVTPECIPKDDRDAGGLAQSLTVSLNSRVMLICNINTSSGLVNGAMGKVTAFNFIHTSPSVIYVRFNSSDIGHPFKSPEHSGAIPIHKIEQSFFHNGHMIVGEQFPLKPCWACTVLSNEQSYLLAMMSLRRAWLT